MCVCEMLAKQLIHIEQATYGNRDLKFLNYESKQTLCLLTPHYTAASPITHRKQEMSGACWSEAGAVLLRGDARE